MTDFMYDLQRQVNELKENPTSIGFMRNNSLFAYDVNENRVITSPADCDAREKAIKNSHSSSVRYAPENYFRIIQGNCGGIYQSSSETR